MEPQGSASFIPKTALVAQTRGRGLGIFMLLALFLFATSIVSAGGAFLYKGLLNQRIANADASLQKAEGAFEASTIQDLSRMDSRMNQARQLLQRHVAFSAIFGFLSSITLPSVQFSSMNLSVDTDGSGKLNLSGSADSFSTVALQSDQFGSNKSLRDVIFSGISVGQDGKVAFSISATVDPSVLSYVSNLSTQSSAATTQ